MELGYLMNYTPIGQPAQKLNGGRAPAPAPQTETGLIRAAQQGDLSAFNRLVLAHQDSLYGWVISLVRDETLADDITQSTFVTAYEKLATFRGVSLRAWLFRIARNRSFDMLRYQKRHPSVSLDDSMQDEDADDLLAVLPSNDPSPEEAYIQAERTAWLMKLMDKLPAPFRQALELIDIFEMDYLEAASVLGVSLGTLKSRVARARLKLREQIKLSREML